MQDGSSTEFGNAGEIPSTPQTQRRSSQRDKKQTANPGLCPRRVQLSPSHRLIPKRSQALLPLPEISLLGPEMPSQFWEEGEKSDPDFNPCFLENT